MATITVETIEKLNIVSVLAGLEQHRKAEAALNSVIQTTNASKKEATKVIGAQARALQKEGDEIEAITAKWEAARAAERGYEIAAQSAIGSTKNLAGGMTNLSFQLNDVVTGLASGQKPMQIFAQQGGQIFQAFQQTPGLLAGVASGLGTVGAGVAALAAPLGSVLIPLWWEYSDAQDQATASLKAWNEAEDAALPLLDKATKDVEKLKELTEGSLTLDQTKAKIAKQYGEQLEAANRPLKERIDVLEEEQRTLAKTDARYVMVIDELKEKKKQILENNDAAAKGAVASALVAEFAYEEAESERVLTERKKAATDARKAARDAAKEEADALKELLFLQGIDDKIEALDASDLFDTQSIYDGVETFEEAQTRMAQAANKRAQAVMDLEANLARVQREGYEQAGQFAADYVKSAGGMFEVLYEQKARLAEKGDQEAAQSAVKLFEINRIASLSEAAINTLVAVSKASTSAPPPYNLVPMGVAAAQGAVTVGAILAEPAPTFNDTPGVQQMRGTGPTPVTLAPDDFFAASKSRDGLLAQILDAVSSPRGGSPMGRRPEAGNILSYDPVRLFSRDLPRIVRGGMN